LNQFYFSLIIGECNLINPAIRTIVSPDGHTLFISNIHEEDLAKLVFPTNSDVDNNKLSLVDVRVFLERNPTLPVKVPGLVGQLKIAFNNSNSRAFRGKEFPERIHRPFAEIPAGTLSPEKPFLTTPELTDILAGITALTQPLKGREKLYSLTFTNDAAGRILNEIFDTGQFLSRKVSTNNSAGSSEN